MMTMTVAVPMTTVVSMIVTVAVPVMMVMIVPHDALHPTG